jgi:hypothetical protein
MATIMSLDGVAPRIADDVFRPAPACRTTR